MLQFALTTLFASLRVGPTLAFVPPFTLMRVPVSIRVILSISLGALLITLTPLDVAPSVMSFEMLLALAVGELMIGICLGLTLQLVFAAMLMVGRAIDIQAGFGLALIIDPTTGGQMPLIGTIFVYGAAAVFFGIGGPGEMLAIWAQSMSIMPIGSFVFAPDLTVLFSFMSTAFLIATGLAGVVLLTLFLIDLSVAFISRTLPQMNVLLIGFQVKTLAILITVPLAIAVSATTFLRLIRLALDFSLQIF